MSVQYSLHFPRGGYKSEQLAVLCLQILEVVRNSVASGYVWQRAPFALSVDSEGLSLHGSVALGESVEDEWKVVSILLQVSTASATDAVIRVADSDDGQFILIEAADVLPKWCNPDNAENRLWICNGQLHLVPIEHADDSEGRISQARAIEAVANPAIPTLAPPAISSVIERKLASVISTPHNHCTLAYLPSELVSILLKDPQLISSAVAAFYDRDALQLKHTQFMARFSPSHPKLAQVKMNRSLYAQLMSQKFYPPKPFLKAGWFPPELAEESKEYRYRDLGMKVACGFEMMYQESSASVRNRGTQVEIQRGGSMKQQTPFLKYMVALTSAGYFKGESAGSKLYNELEAKAVEYWDTINADPAALQEGSKAKIDKLAAEVKAEQAVTLAPGDAYKPKVKEEAKDLEEDSDEWLYLTQADLDVLISSKSTKPVQAPEVSDVEVAAAHLRNEGDDEEDEDETLANKEAQKLKDIADKFGHFLEGEGDVDGAMFEDDDDEGEYSDDESDNDAMEQDEQVAGPNTLSEEEKHKRMEKLVAPLEAKEWGQQPSTLDGTYAPSKASSNPKQNDQGGRFEENPSREKYDGVSDSSSDSEEDQAMSGPSQKLHNRIVVDEEESDEEAQPQIANLPHDDDEGDDIQFGTEEMTDFLDFTRKALGLTEAQYRDIVEQRKGRGAFVPKDSVQDTVLPTVPPSNETDPDRTIRPLPKPTAFSPTKQPASILKKPSAPSSGSGASTAFKAPKPLETLTAPTQQNKRPSKGANPRLDNFEALMDAMEAELSTSRLRSPSSSPSQQSIPKPSASATRQSKPPFSTTNVIDDDEEEQEDEEIDMQLDAELHRALHRDPSEILDENEHGNGNDYTLIKNFLESFSAQQGQAGPVGNLVGRLGGGARLPRDARQ